MPQHLPRLQIITPGTHSNADGAGIEGLLHQLPPCLPCMVQLREKELHARTLLTLARKARACALPKGSLLLINERTDIALAAGLDGVNLPEEGCPTAAVRRSAPNLLIGRSTHSIEAVRRAGEEGADYVLFSPVFDTPSKRAYGPPQGIRRLAEACRVSTVPVLALGGVTPDNAAACLDAGAWGVAALGPFRDLAGLPLLFEKLMKILPQ